jgi:uncharacterized DUF497 family protein
LLWTWDPNKDAENVQKHGTSFDTAQLVFNDQHFKTLPDPYPWEQRWQTTGRIGNTIVFVVHTWPTPDLTGRIISARKATPSERRAYEER